MTRTINIFKRPSEGRIDVKRIERSIDGVREYCDIWGNGIVQLEKNLEAGTTNIYIHSESGSKKFKLANSTTWFDQIVSFIPYEEENTEDNFRVINLAPNNNIFITIGKATDIVVNCD